MVKLNSYAHPSHRICMLCTFLRYLLFLLVAVFLTSCSEENATVEPAPKEFTVIDQGLNMPVATYTLPHGWTLEHDIATDVYSGESIRYKLDISGPQGQMMRSLSMQTYGQYSDSGHGFEQVWRDAAQQALQDILQNIIIGKPRESGPLVDKIKSNQNFNQGMQKMGVKKLFEVDFSATRNGKPHVGKMFVADIPTLGQSGIIIMGLLFSPVGMIMQTIDTDFKISELKKPNLKYEQTLRAITECQPIWRAGNGMIDFITIDGKTVRNDPRELNPDLNARCQSLKIELHKATGKTSNSYMDSTDRVYLEDSK